eukprot:jgi/Botrbrau1/19848/Bobra.0124s0084.1
MLDTRPDQQGQPGPAKVPVGLAAYGNPGPIIVSENMGPGATAHPSATDSLEGPGASRITTFRITKSVSLHMASLLARPISRREDRGTPAPSTVRGYKTQWLAVWPIATSNPSTALLRRCDIALRPSQREPGVCLQSTAVRLYRLRKFCPPHTASCGMLTILQEGQRNLGRKFEVEVHDRRSSCFPYPNREALKSRNPPDLASAAVVGLLRTIVLEDSALRLKVLQSDVLAGESLDNNVASGGEPVVGFQAQLQYSPRLMEHEAMHMAHMAQGMSESPGGFPGASVCHVISGGGGALALLTANWLAEGAVNRQFCHILLLSRSASGFPSLSACFAPHASVTVVAADVASRAGCVSALSIGQAHGLLPRQLFHAAGTVRDALWQNQTCASVRAVFAGKVQGARALLDVTQWLPMAGSHLYSSISATLGNAGQCNYAAANSSLLQLATEGANVGSPLSAVGWGPWGGRGMATSQLLLSRLHKLGMAPILPAYGLALLSKVVASLAFQALYPRHMVVSVAGVLDWRQLLVPAPRQQPFYAEFQAHHELLKQNVSKTVRHLPGEASESDLMAQLRDVLIATLGKDVTADDPLMEAGLDSLASLELRNRVSQMLGERCACNISFRLPHSTRIGKIYSTAIKWEACARPRHSHRPSTYPCLSIKEGLHTIAKQVLGVAVSDDQPLMEAGLDSLGAVELRNAISNAYRIHLPATILFDYPTLAALTGKIIELVDPVKTPELPQDKSTSLTAMIRTAVSNLLGRDIEDTEPLMEAGLDSLASVELQNTLASMLRREVPATLIMDYPTISALCAYLQPGHVAEHRHANSLSAAVALPQVGARRHSKIVGAACRFPQASGLEDFWSNIWQQKTVQAPAPLCRWDVDRFYDPDVTPGCSYARFAAYTKGLEMHDATFFRLNRSEAVALDPQTRVLLEISEEALSEGAVILDVLPSWRKATGTYVGCMFVDHFAVLRQAYGYSSTGPVMTGNGLPYQSGRLAYTFGLQGPCNGIDTACSSSLVAIHNAHAGRLLTDRCMSASALQEHLR